MRNEKKEGGKEVGEKRKKKKEGSKKKTWEEEEVGSKNSGERGAKEVGSEKRKEVRRKRGRREKEKRKEGRKKRREEERISKEFDVDRTIKPEPIDLKFCYNVLLNTINHWIVSNRNFNGRIFVDHKLFFGDFEIGFSIGKFKVRVLFHCLTVRSF